MPYKKKGYNLNSGKSTRFKKGDKHPKWKGGSFVDSSGYVMIKCEDHPYLNHPQGYVYEHRLIMEKHLGRILLPSEVVHHINNNRKDNRIENLMLFSSNKEHIIFHRDIERRSR